MQRPCHFYVVFNPMINDNDLYQTQAHEFYQKLRDKVLASGADEGFMYWGKLKVDGKDSSNIDEFRSVIEENKIAGEETHLYITDYHHFWVAKVDNVLKEVHNQESVLPFYDNKDVEMWFKVTDMELLSAEFEETAFYLKQLYVDNDLCDKKIESINPYLGGLKFPLIVQDNSDERYFKNVYSEDVLRVSTQNPLIVCPKFIDNLTFNMKSFVLPPEVFGALSTLTRKELLSVESSLSKSSHNDGIYFGQVLSSYNRILESVMNNTVGKILKSEFSDCLFIDCDGSKFVEETQEGSISIGNFKDVISLYAFTELISESKKFGNINLKDLEVKYPEIVSYFSQTLVPFIRDEELVSLRGLSQNSQTINTSKEKAFFIRNKILGVGCVGVINTLHKFLQSYESQIHMKKVS